ncbi:MAG: hypothetical protein QOE93_2497 [Actinomycetota bacterium]|nr:hypothetical protein [Actinomycetota bacterium]
MTVNRRATTGSSTDTPTVDRPPTRTLPRPATEDPHLRAALVAVVETARCCVDGCADATVAVLVGAETVTLAATEPYVVELDCFQYETGE